MVTKAKLYLDEDVSEILAGKLRKLAWDVLTVSEAARRGKTDEDQLAFAAETSRVLITRNFEDFPDLHVVCLETETIHAGIIVCFWRPNMQVTYNKLMRLLERIPPNQWPNRLEYA